MLQYNYLIISIKTNDNPCLLLGNHTWSENVVPGSNLGRASRKSKLFRAYFGNRKSIMTYGLLKNQAPGLSKDLKTFLSRKAVRETKIFGVFSIPEKDN